MRGDDSAIRSSPHLGRIKRNAKVSPVSKEQEDAINAALTIATDDRHAEAFPVMTVQGKRVKVRRYCLLSWGCLVCTLRI